MDPLEKLEKAAALVRSRCSIEPRIGIVLGSGLGPVADSLEDRVAVPYSEIPGFPATTVPGHRGELVIGRLSGVPVAAMMGRFHLYEGRTPAEVVFPIRLFHALGAQTLIATNAAGGLRHTLAPGTLMVFSDHINLPGLVGQNPLVGEGDAEHRFVVMSNAYDEGLRRLALDCAGSLGIRAESGVYVMVAGPSFETPAEARMLLHMGADAVGMSTVPETVMARRLGMSVLAISLITNTHFGPPVHPQGGHEEVLDAARAGAGDLASLLRMVIERLTATLQ